MRILDEIKIVRGLKLVLEMMVWILRIEFRMVFVVLFIVVLCYKFY